MDWNLEMARHMLWEKAGLLSTSITPSLDVMTLAFAKLTSELHEANARFERFLLVYEQQQAIIDALIARERKEHEAVSGTIKFVPGLPVKGRITFTSSVDPTPK